MDSHPVYSLIVSPNILNELVCDFEREINSKRQQSKISSIGDLIVVLYKRNVVDRSNFNDILDNVLNRFPSTGDKGKIKDFINLLDRRIDCHNANKNQYAELRRLNSKPNVIAAPKPTHVTGAVINFNTKKSQIYKVIADAMENWREFGRELNLSESVLLNLDRQSDRDIPTITHRILEMVEARRNDNFFNHVIEALEANGRKDIIKKIRSILNQ